MKVEEILQEIESMAMLDHPNVIKAGKLGTRESSGSFAACGLPIGYGECAAFKKT